MVNGEIRTVTFTANSEVRVSQIFNEIFYVKNSIYTIFLSLLLDDKLIQKRKTSEDSHTSLIHGRIHLNWYE